MGQHRSNLRAALLGATALAGALALSAGSAAAQEREFTFDLPAQPLGSALRLYARTAQEQVIFTDEAVRGRTAPALNGAYSAEEALQVLLAGTDLQVHRTTSGILQITDAADPQGGSAAGGGAEVEALIVTAQKREEDIQDVPIAISAFSQEDLTRSQVAGGPDLMTQVPNMTFTKTNFSSYSIQIRGIGTQAISATTDPAVAVAFNNTPFIRNRFFEQEFYDLQRVEVLRGPQGTLYGRNATAGVVNIISAKPKFVYEAKLSGDVANYSSTRLEGMVNIPLVEDKAAVRIAGAWTKREGFVKNILNGEQTDGRDLWSVRVSLGIEPTDWLRTDIIYEHFEENDDRLRTGKQLCRKDLGPTSIGGTPVSTNTGFALFAHSGYFSQGCKPASLYSPDSFETPNGYSLQYYGPAGSIGSPVYTNLDPYLNATQSRNLREIETHLEPDYEASSDMVEVQSEIQLSDNLTLTSETAFSRDTIFSFQDFNRFATRPGVFAYKSNRPELVSAEGVFCDPQLGCTDRLAAGDLSTAKSEQFSQELRLGSDFGGPVNFSAGANFIRYDTEDKYYVFINSLSAFTGSASGNLDSGQDYVPWGPGQTNDLKCMSNGYAISNPNEVYPISQCVYVDPNPIHSLNDQGRNYFLSRNPYRLLSYGVFGELYYNISQELKFTTGFRWTIDKKTAPQLPSWLLATATYGTPARKIINQEWDEPTGRIALDWKPHLSFTDETLVYGSYVRGYKAGGANPPPPVVVLFNQSPAGDAAALSQSLTHPETFDAEYVNAFEAGTKNTLLDGRLTFNAAAFYYDYKGYQISQIVDRSAVNLNFDADIWGAEIETDWRPLENLRIGFKGGYENTRLADGSKAIDLMDRTAGNPDWFLFKPFPPMPSNCVLPGWFAAMIVGTFNTDICSAYIKNVDYFTNLPYVPDPQFRFGGGSGTGSIVPINVSPVGGVDLTGYPGFDPASAPNNGEGFEKDLGGNELPNAPHFTGTLTVDYTVPLPNEWLVTLHTDLYYQSEAWTRVFNTEGYDKLKAYTNVNLAAVFTNEDAGWNVMAYVKNVFDRDSITGAFLNSDDTGLTTNVFLTEPRLYGLRITKNWSGGSLPRGGSSGVHAADYVFPLTVEVSGDIARMDNGADLIAPSWIGRWRPAVAFPFGSQEQDLDGGDGRGVRLTYAPAGKDGWRIVGAFRYGKANGRAWDEVTVPGVQSCFKYNVSCALGPNNWATDGVEDRQNFTIADFSVGRDVGLGAWGKNSSSVLSGGVRYAEFTSDRDIEFLSYPDRYLPPQWAVNYDVHWHRYNTHTQADRRFQGVGPIIAWDASTALLGATEIGQVSLDWGLTGGVLFGRRKVTVREDTVGRYVHGLGAEIIEPFSSTLTSVDVSQSAKVPVAGASLGLSYSLDRLKLGAGYRWERYFNAIDGGGVERKNYDRTIDGPYVKLSFGFGG